jgi:uncharacterized protein (TIGR00255 family)
MPKSMTGFARADHSVSWGNIVCELKSVNHRFLDLSFRMPDNLRAFEHDLREQIRSSLTRGKVECSLSLKTNSSVNAELQLDKGVAKSYIEAADELTELVANSQAINLIEILQLPGVLASQEIDSDDLKVLAASVLKECIGLLEHSRQREGDVLGKEILDRTEQLRALTSSLSEVVPAIRQSQEEKLRQRLADAGIDINQDRLEQELIILAQKMDVEEEIDRLNAHLDQIDELIAGNKPVGRKLDFLMQELNREANTLGSKSQGLTQTNIAVEMKVLIEQIREQIQNIE